MNFELCVSSCAISMDAQWIYSSQFSLFPPRLSGAGPYAEIDPSGALGRLSARFSNGGRKSLLVGRFFGEKRLRWSELVVQPHPRRSVHGRMEREMRSLDRNCPRGSENFSTRKIFLPSLRRLSRREKSVGLKRCMNLRKD